MQGWRRALAWLAGGLAGLLLLAIAGLYGWTEYLLRRDHGVPLAAGVPMPTDAASREHGRLRATLVGCYGGCHGDTVEGQVWADSWLDGRLTAPNLTVILPTYSDAELLRLLRHGVRRDGSTAFVMPPAQFRHLSDADLGAIIAFLRGLPPVPGLEHRRSFGPRGRLGLALRDGIYPSVEDVDSSVPLAGNPPPATPLERGRYIAMITCPECHGPSLDGYPGDTPPPLVIVASYSQSEFTRLMRTGIAKGGRELGLMSLVGRKRTPTLTDQEVAELYLYLRSRAGLPPDPT